MRHVRSSHIVLLLCLAGCASAPLRLKPPQDIVIDTSHHRASGPGWESGLVDCSDATFVCFEAPGRFVMAFSRSCPRDVGPWMHTWIVAGYPFRFTAPGPHAPLPGGGYYSEKYPHTYLIFDPGFGFRSLWIRSNPVASDNWGGSSVAEYEIRYAGGPSPFICR